MWYFFITRILYYEGENEIYLVSSEDFTFADYSYKYFGYVKVVEDINNINLEEIYKEVGKYKIFDKDYLSEVSGLSCH